MRLAAIASLLLTVGLGGISGLLFLIAFQFRFEWFADPAPLVAAGPTSAEFLRWAAITDLVQLLPANRGGRLRPVDGAALAWMAWCIWLIVLLWQRRPPFVLLSD